MPQPNFMIHAAWVLSVAYAMAVVYELWRALVKRNVSRHDSMHVYGTCQIQTRQIAVSSH